MREHRCLFFAGQVTVLLLLLSIQQSEGEELLQECSLEHVGVDDEHQTKET